MYNLKKPNPLEFFKARRLTYLPSYFEVVDVKITYNIDTSIINWIKSNTKGRFYVGKGLSISNQNSVETVLKVGFENSKEASYFILACPHLKYN